jgi:uncharacterized 2Fe-2S/4Fe-4S cluster protein (DUF4445 family)
MPDSKDQFTAIFQPSGKRGLIDCGKTIKEASILLGVDIEGGCGQKGTCGKCKVRLGEGNFEKYGIRSKRDNLSPFEESEREFISDSEEQQGYRLACRAQLRGDVVVFVPEESQMGKQVVRKAAREIKYNLNPAVKHYILDVPEATLKDPSGDWERLQRELKLLFGLENPGIDYHVLLTLQNELRRNGWQISADVWQDREVIKVSSGKVKTAFGLAVDIGTTTLAGYLCDLASGELIATVSAMNPQVLFGEDVMSRISFTMTNPEGLATLNRTIIDGINALIAQACAAAGIGNDDILDMTVVGNTCMHHLFLNIDPRYLGKAPFAIALQHSLDIKARGLGAGGLRIAPGAYVHVLPIEAGFVGADNVGVLISEKPYEQDSLELIIDIGTNGELILGNRDHLVSCSCATGPALEGAEIRNGMRAAPGAIEKIEIDRSTREVRFKVIGKQEWNSESASIGAKGICGSAIIDLLPQMFLAGIIDKTGRFAAEVNTPRFRLAEGGGREFVIAWANETSTGRDIAVSQKDIRAIQLAKAAMYAGARIMMAKLGVDKIDKVILAGAFGSYVDKQSAARLGLFPDCDLGNVYAVGNAAGDGARLALLDAGKRLEADSMSRKVEYIELTGEPDFERLFVQAMWIPHMKDEFPHLDKQFS